MPAFVVAGGVPRSFTDFRQEINGVFLLNRCDYGLVAPVPFGGVQGVVSRADKCFYPAGMFG